MSLVDDIETNRRDLAVIHRAGTAYLAASLLPVHALVYCDEQAETARGDLEDCLARIVGADPRDSPACLQLLRDTRDAMGRLDMAIGLVPGAPPLVVRWWRALHARYRRPTPEDLP